MFEKNPKYRHPSFIVCTFDSFCNSSDKTSDLNSTSLCDGLIPNSAPAYALSASKKISNEISLSFLPSVMLVLEGALYHASLFCKIQPNFHIILDVDSAVIVEIAF